MTVRVPEPTREAQTERRIPASNTGTRENDIRNAGRQLRSVFQALSSPAHAPLAVTEVERSVLADLASDISTAVAGLPSYEGVL